MERGRARVISRIGKVHFDPVKGGPGLRPYEDYGIFLKDYSVSPAVPKSYFVSLDGADGSLDLSDWAGEIKYEPRTVEINLRDMNERHLPIVQALNGRRWRITFFDDPHWYYEGRCDSVSTETRRRVTDIGLTFTCSPWKTKHVDTIMEKAFSPGTKMVLRAERKTVIPKIKVSSACNVIWNGETYRLTSGTHTPAWFVLTDSYNQMLEFDSGSGIATVSWRDGVL